MATTDSVKQHKLRKLIAWLADKEGKDKDFISLYIPPEATIDKIIATIKKENTSIDEKSERIEGQLQKNLKKLIQRLKQEKEIPANGLVVFAGTFPTNNPVLTFEEIVPPEPLAMYLCVVDNHFQLEPLRAMLRDQKVVGLIALDAKEACFGILIGEHFKLLKTITSGIPGKSGKGGQSQRRYERERNMELTNFFHRIAEHATKLFLENYKVTVLLIGGPGLTKTDFLKGTYLHYELKNMLLDTVDTQSAGPDGVKEMLRKSFDVLKGMCAPEEKRTVQRLMEELAKQYGLVTYGLDSVLEALREGQAEVAIVTDNTGMIENVVLCKRCGLSKAKILDKRNAPAISEMILSPCERCGAVDYAVEEKDIVDVLEDAATQTDAIVEVISTMSEEKSKLASLGGFAAFLRYRHG
ncbi:MAG: peptide chain release factor aRF-1 [Candidatus Bathyarchaeota archaeon]|nr:peptide chain release factor aRF-1 [Candidatus Bathyarchaeota archaeon]